MNKKIFTTLAISFFSALSFAQPVQPNPLYTLPTLAQVQGSQFAVGAGQYRTFLANNSGQLVLGYRTSAGWVQTWPPTGLSTQVMLGNGAFANANASLVGLGGFTGFTPATLPLSNADIAALGLKEDFVALGLVSQYQRGDKTWATLNKASVGLGNVDNTSDVDKPISALTQNALGLKENSIAAGTTTQYWRGDKTWQLLNGLAVGLGNVDDTSDVNKPISTATATALAGKLNNPAGTALQLINGLGGLATIPTTLPPNGAAGGDLSGTYPNPTVSRLLGRTLNATAPLVNQAYLWNGTEFAPTTVLTSYVAPDSLPNWSASDATVTSGSQRKIAMGGVTVSMSSTATQTTGANFTVTEAGFWTYLSQSTVGSFPASSVVLSGYQILFSGQLYQSNTTRTTGVAFDAGEQTNWTALGSSISGARVTFSNFSTSGVLGTALVTVDAGNLMTFNQTTANVSVTLPAPGIVTVHKTITISNLATSTASISVVGGDTILLAPGQTREIAWNGTNWRAVAPANLQAHFLEANFPTVTSANIATGDHPRFSNILASIGTAIFLDTVSGYTSSANVASIGRFTLQPNISYELEGDIGDANGASNNSGFIAYAWFNADTGTELSASSPGFTAVGNVFPSNGVTRGVARASFTPTSVTRVELRFTTSSNILSISGGLNGQRASAKIKAIAGQLPISNVIASIMGGSSAGTAGTAGSVPIPAAGTQNYPLYGSGVWGASRESTVSLANVASSGTIGAANVSVDIASLVKIPQTTNALVLTIPNATVATNDRWITFLNTGSATTTTLNGVPWLPLQPLVFMWDGTGYRLQQNIRQGGNSFAIGLDLGTNDAQVVNLRTGAVTRFQVANNAATITGQGATVYTSTGTLTASSAAGNAAAFSSGTTGAASFDSGTTGTVGVGTNANAKAITVGNIIAGTTVQMLGQFGFGATSVITNNGAGAQFDAVNNTASLIRFTVAGTTTVSGFVAPTFYKELVLINATSSTMSLLHNTTSVAANQISTPTGTNFDIPVGGTTTLIYDVVGAKWRVKASPVQSLKCIVIAQSLGGQSIASGAVTDLTTWASVRDTTASFNVSTGVFTAPRDGDYNVQASIQYQAGALLSANAQVSLELGGSVRRAAYKMFVSGAAMDQATVELSSTIRLTAGQTIKPQSFQNTGSARLLGTTAGQNVISVTELGTTN